LELESSNPQNPKSEIQNPKFLQTFAVTAWQWLKLEWHWAVPAVLFGAVVLGVCIRICIRIVRNRRSVTAVVEDHETNPNSVLSIANGTDAGPTPESQSFEGNGHQLTDEQRSTDVARNQRIRAEIEALHKARVEQRERIEASTIGRAGDHPREQPLRLPQSNHINQVISAMLPKAISGLSGNGVESGRVEPARTQTESAEEFRFLTDLFDDPSQDVRNVAARALYRLQSDRAASFTRALREASPERRRRIGAALATSGLATEALSNLAGANLDKAYDAFSVLFLMAKAGEVESLIKVIEDSPYLEVRLAVVKLLALSGQAEVVSSFRRLAVRGSLPPEVRTAVMEAIHQLRP
jgi:hypothetical protein